jgi:hypothetical protein
MSSDGGLTWTTPIKVNHTPVARGAAAFVPWVHLAEDGVVAVSYYDFRNNATLTACRPTTGPSTATRAARAEWAGRGDARRGTVRHGKGADTERGEFLGDYTGLASVGNAFTPFFAQSAAVTDKSDTRFARVTATP